MELFRIAPKGYEAARPDGRLLLVSAPRSSDLPELPDGATCSFEREALAPHFVLPRDELNLQARLRDWGAVDFARRYKVVVTEIVMRTYDVMAISRQAASDFALECSRTGDKRAIVRTEIDINAETHRG